MIKKMISDVVVTTPRIRPILDELLGVYDEKTGLFTRGYSDKTVAAKFDRSERFVQTVRRFCVDGVKRPDILGRLLGMFEAAIHSTAQALKKHAKEVRGAVDALERKDAAQDRRLVALEARLSRLERSGAPMEGRDLHLVADQPARVTASDVCEAMMELEACGARAEPRSIAAELFTRLPRREMEAVEGAVRRILEGLAEDGAVRRRPDGSYRLALSGLAVA